MVINVRRLAALVALVSAPVAGCANAYDGQGPDRGVRAELPAHAPPGDCYARVAVPGEIVAPPPVQQGAQWVQNPGPPGSPGPIWCLEPTGPAAGPPPVQTLRYGWIRVLCDRDVTPERIGRLQHRLHDRGYYRGDYSGRYDRATAEGVERFQRSAHIPHGGYLSLDTLQALDADQDRYDRADQGPPPGPPQGPPPPYGYAGAPGGYQSPAYQPPAGYGYPVPVPVPYAYPVPVPVPTFAPAAACGCQPGFAPPVYYQQAYPQSYGYGGPTPAYASAAAQAYAGAGGASAQASSRVVQDGWLMWNGKSGFDGR